jgi:hypothetical protein
MQQLHVQGTYVAPYAVQAQKTSAVAARLPQSLAACLAWNGTQDLGCSNQSIPQVTCWVGGVGVWHKEQHIAVAMCDHACRIGLAYASKACKYVFCMLLWLCGSQQQHRHVILFCTE